MRLGHERWPASIVDRVIYNIERDDPEEEEDLEEATLRLTLVAESDAAENQPREARTFRDPPSKRRPFSSARDSLPRVRLEQRPSSTSIDHYELPEGVGVLGPSGRERRVRGALESIPSRPREGYLQESAARAVHSATPALTGCYESMINRGSEEGGRVVLSWLINADGSPSNVHVASTTITDAAFHTCLLGVIRSLRFPGAVDGPVEVNYPFLFNAPER
jgi:hypothetical protein